MGDSLTSQVSEIMAGGKGQVECETFAEGEVFAFDSLHEQLIAGKCGAVALPAAEVLETLVHILKS